MSRVALIHPIVTINPPLGLMVLAAVLEQAGHEVIIRPMHGYADHEHPIPLRILRAFDPDVIGVGYMSAEQLPGERTIMVLRSLFPDALIVAGGRHPSTFPQETLNAGADTVVIGEGESTLLNIVNTCSGDAILHGVVDSAGLDIIPAYHLAPYQRYIDARTACVGRYLRYGLLATSRGCFAKCIYCRDSRFGARHRVRHMDAIFADIEVQQRHFNIDGLYIVDDLFAVNESRVLEFCDRFRRTGLSFTAVGRTDTVTLPMIKALKRAGCVALGFGVESGSERIHEFLHTGKKLSTVIPAFDMCHSVGLTCGSNFIVGVPGETEEDIDQTVKLIRRIKPDTVGCSFLTAYPGTPLYDMAIQEEWITQEGFPLLAFRHSHPVSQLNSGIPDDVLAERRRRIYAKTFWRSTFRTLFRHQDFYALIRDMLIVIYRYPKDGVRLVWTLLCGDRWDLLYKFYDLLFGRNIYERHKGEFH